MILNIFIFGNSIKCLKLHFISLYRLGLKGGVKEFNMTEGGMHFK